MVEPLFAAAPPLFSDDLLLPDHPGLEGPPPPPEAAEEELEWLSVFPSVEDCFTSATAAGCDLSPVSVLALAAAPPCPVKPRSKVRRRGRLVLPVFPPPPPPQRCRHCQAEETPQWRMGPEGPKTLCNACGVRYKSGRLVPEYRPASSPTFSAREHSNSHRRIVEMRRRRGGGGSDGGVAAV